MLGVRARLVLSRILTLASMLMVAASPFAAVHDAKAGYTMLLAAYAMLGTASILFASTCTHLLRTASQAIDVLLSMRAHREGQTN